MKQGYLVSLLAVVTMLASLAACTAPGGQRFRDLPLSDQPLTGKFVWHDLITDDVDGIRRFYGGLMGWSFDQCYFRVTVTNEPYVGD